MPVPLIFSMPADLRWLPRPLLLLLWNEAEQLPSFPSCHVFVYCRRGLVTVHLQDRVQMLEHEHGTLHTLVDLGRLRCGTDSGEALVFAFNGHDQLAAELTTLLPPGLWLPKGAGVIGSLERLLDRAETSLTRGAGSSLVTRLLAGIADYNLGGRRAEAALSDLVRAARERLQEAIESDRGISDIAHELRVDQSRLIRQFQREVGLTPGKYLASLRVRRACELLRTTNLTIAAIAARLGYDSPPHFAKLFQHVTGLTPSAYRDRRSATPFAE